VARSCSPNGGFLFTNHENDTLYWGPNVYPGVSVASAQAGPQGLVLWWGAQGFKAIEADPPQPPAGGGLDARFALAANGQGWLTQWHRTLNALVIYPWLTSGDLSGYALSSDEHDFNHDIGCRDDGVMIVATGVNQGETSCRYYEIDFVNRRFRVNGGAFQALVAVPMTPVAPPLPSDPAIPPDAPLVTLPGYTVPAQASYGRRGYCGPYFATDIRNKGYGTNPDDFWTDGNTEMVVNGTVLGGNQKVNRPVFVGLACVGNPVEKMLGFLNGANDNSMGNAALKECHRWALANGYPGMKMVRYYDGTPIPQDFINTCGRDDIVQVQCYSRPGEGVTQAMERFVESVDRVIASGRKCGIARGFNTKYGGLGLVLNIQDPLCTMVRKRPAIILDAWFSHGRWYKDVESGAAYHAELIAWEKVLGGLFTGLP
jgi:hypothetical protein